MIIGVLVSATCVMNTELLDLQINYAKLRISRPDPCYILYRTETLVLKIDSKVSYQATLKPTDNTALRSIEGLIIQLDPIEGVTLNQSSLQKNTVQSSLLVQLDYEVLQLQADKTLKHLALSDTSQPKQQVSEKDPTTLVSLAQVNQDLMLTVIATSERRVNVAMECGLIDDGSRNPTTADLVKVSMSKSDVQIFATPSNISFPCPICGQDLEDQQTVVCHVQLGNAVLRNVVPQLTELRKAPIVFSSLLVIILSAITAVAVILLVTMVYLARKKSRKQSLKAHAEHLDVEEAAGEEETPAKRVPTRIVVKQ